MDAPEEFRPEMVSRTGELITWVLAIITIATVIFLWVQNASVSFWQILFALLMLIAAAGSSLSTWMDRKTILTLKPEGIDFQNGLRNISMNWDEIQKVQVLPSRFGDRVNVFGSKTYFNFRTMVEVTTRTGKRNTMGFIQGEQITQKIILNSGLEESVQNERGRYYSRP